MSVSKLQKFVDKPLTPPLYLKKKPILLTSSKGFSLRCHADLIEQFGFKIDFHCKAGAKFPQSYTWLTKHLPAFVNKYGDSEIVLYVWLGTCDLTSKLGKFISLTHNSNEECIQYIKHNVDKFAAHVSNFPTVTLIFLEIPPYSIEVWNRHKGHTNPECYIEDDFILENRIDLLNRYLREVNDQTGVLSLNFRSDLLCYKRAGRKSYLNYSLYKDGIHPDALLGRYWMKRLVTKVFFDCM